ncbi:MAG: hypothetical protein R2713_03360 [Ilumatobacteraceae bacterium]
MSDLGDRLVGIRNGIDTVAWDPSTDPHLVATYGPGDLAGKGACRAAVRAELGLADVAGPLSVVVARLADQKGVDLLLPLLPLLDRMPGQVAVLGDGDAHLADALQSAAAAIPDGSRSTGATTRCWRTG